MAETEHKHEGHGHEGHKHEGHAHEGHKHEEGNVKCSFCGDDAFCGPCRDDPDKAEGFEHMCYGCYQKMGGIPENVKDKTHLCIPPEKAQENFERFMNQVTHRAFEELWNTEKKRLKEMSRQDLAQAAFFEGARFMFHFVNRMSQEQAGGGAQEGGSEPGGEEKQE